MLKLNADRLLATRNVVAVGIGRKNGKANAGWCVRVHVTRKTKHPTKNSVPRVLTPPKGSKWLVPVVTDVEETGDIELHGEAYYVRGGSAICSPLEGTCSGVFFHRGPIYYLLTAGHVISHELVVNATEPSGWLPAGQVIEVKVKPVYEGPDEWLVGRCVRCSSPARPVDLALIELAEGVGPTPNPLCTGMRDLTSDRLDVNDPLQVLVRDHRGVFYTAVPPEVDDKVVTEVPYDVPGGGKVRYEGLVSYPLRGADNQGNTIQLEGGDSGSAVCDANFKLVGIHIAGSKNKQRGYAIPSNWLRRWAPGLELVVP